MDSRFIGIDLFGDQFI